MNQHRFTRRAGGLLQQLAGAVALALLCAAAPGCWPRPPATPLAPPLTSPPTLESLVARINNSARIRQLQTDSATVSLQGMPLKLKANLAVERPQKLRLQGQVFGLGGVDVGSNDELFWIWYSTARPPAVYFARHDQFQQSALGAKLPVRPEWLIEALGIVQLDPAGPLEGPYPRGAGQLEIRTKVPSQIGEMTKIIVVDTTYGWIVQQYLYSPQGELLAAVNASQHRYYAEVDVSLPNHIEVQLPRAQATLQIDVGGYTVNRLYADASQLWRMPEFPGTPAVNVADPGFQFPGAPGLAAPPSIPPIAPRYGAAQGGFAPQYRGFPGRR